MSTSERLIFGNSTRGTIMRIVLLFVLLTFPFFNAYRVTFLLGDSMYPSYNSKELVLVTRNKGFYQPRRYDVVLVNSGGENWIKRIIGLPGDHIKYGTGRLWLNGKRVYEHEYLDLTQIPRSSVITVDVIIPKGHVWVIGDNRADSASGTFEVGDILGKVVY